jgi:gas vesicle structural protein
MSVEPAATFADRAAPRDDVADGHDAALQKEATLLDLVDRLLDKGVVLTGDVTLSVADVDLVYVGLRVLISSVEAAQRHRGGEVSNGASG